MTATVVDPRLAADINTIRPRCDVTDTDGNRCTEPAHWIVTWTNRATQRTVTELWCIDCYARITAHRAHCALCTGVFDIKAVEL